MGYDDRNNPAVLYIDLDAKKEQFEAAMKDYREKSEVVIAQIAASTEQLNLINGELIEKRKELQELIDDKTAQLEHVVDNLDIVIERKRDNISDLEKDIADRIAQRDAIQTDFSKMQADIDAQKLDLENRMASFAVIQQDFAAQEENFKALQKDFNDQQLQANRDLEATQAALANRTSAAIGAEQVNFQRTKELEDIRVQQENTELILNEKQKLLDDALAAAQPILAQAAAIQAQIDSLDARKAAADAQERKNQDDSNQIIVTQQAQAKRNAELNSRESAVRAAEAAIAGRS